MKSCTDLFQFNEMNHVSLVTNAPPTTTTTSADISTMDCLNETPSPSDSTPTGTEHITCSSDVDEHRTLCSQVDIASKNQEGSGTILDVEGGFDSLLGELVVGEEMTEDTTGGGGGGGGKDGEEGKTKERKKPPVTKRSVRLSFKVVTHGY